MCGYVWGQEAGVGEVGGEGENVRMTEVSKICFTHLLYFFFNLKCRFLNRCIKTK